MSVKSFAQLKKNLKNDFSNLKTLKVALLGDSSTQLLNVALRGIGYECGLNLEIWEADFNQIERQVFDNSSELYKHQPQIVIIFKSSQKLIAKYNKANKFDLAKIASDELEMIANINNRIKTKLNTTIIYYNFPEINDSVYGNYANNIESSFLYQIRKLNYELMNFSKNNANFFVCDLSSIQNLFGRTFLFQSSIYINSDMVLSVEALPVVANRTVDIIKAIDGKIKKCLILDLDNTLWGGIIGDDGIENIQIGDLGIGKAFTEFQYWIKQLKNRGIIIAICSKNTESVAKEPFEKHPEMVLRLDDIAVFIANWNNKADNIRYIQSILNIGFDTMVFLDDNPFERNLVKEHIPEITVPELPEDPADFLDYLYSLNLFETVSISEEDAERTSYYQTEALRSSSINQFTNENSFLESLNMESLVEPFNSYNSPRVAQLTQRSNQFNLRTVRYSEQEINAISTSEDHYTFTFTLTDKFGDNGLICVIILHKENNNSLFIDTWLMSCRVLKRTMENFVLNTIVEHAAEKGFSKLRGEFHPTAKNEIVKNHYSDLGFVMDGNYWFLDLNSYQSKNCFIKKKELNDGTKRNIKILVLRLKKHVKFLK